MDILFLGPSRASQQRIIEFLIKSGDSVTRSEANLEEKKINFQNHEFLISYGYRYIIKKDVLNYFKWKAINLHISYLPWNKGVDPNLWSILENTPKGVTIHQMDYDLDTGQILCQEEISFDEDDTLRSSYDKLQTGLEALFKANWKNIKYNKVIPKRQKGTGSYHKFSDKNSYQELLTDGWDTKIMDLMGKAIDA